MSAQPFNPFANTPQISLLFLHREIRRVGDLIAFSILFYDYLLTFPAEVRHFWRPRCNLACVLFFAIRYVALCVHILNITQVFMETQPGGKPVCTSIETIEQVGIMTVQLFGIVIMTMRVYALYEKSRIVLVSLCVLALALLAFSFWTLFLNHSGTIGEASMMGCGFYVNPTMSLHLAVAWGGLLIFDSVIFVLTVWKSYCIGRLGDRSLVDILLRDGSMYFAVISAVNIGNICILTLATAPYRALTGSFTNSFTTILVSRMMLNLQEPTRRRLSLHDESDAPMMTTVVALDDLCLSMEIDDSDLWSTQRRSRTVLRG